MEFEDAFNRAVAIALRTGELRSAEIASLSYSEWYGSELFVLRNIDHKIIIEVPKGALLIEPACNELRTESSVPKGYDPGLARSRMNQSFNDKRWIHGKKKAFQRRLRDVGWGYAFGHIIPGVGIYYALSRSTYTPYLFCLGGQLAIVLLVLILGIPFEPDSRLGALIYLISFASTVYWAKLGIDQARVHAKVILREREDDNGENVDDLTSDDDSEPITGKINKLLRTIPFSFEKKDELDHMEVQLEKLKSMLDRGLISEEEYQAIRKKKLGI